MVYSMEKIKSKLKSKAIFYAREDVKEGDKVVIIDDVLATGGTLNAAIKLIEQQGGQVVQILLINRV
jgi:adenine/guanine phosphoribosyltransferase-like PRPP-binding protein